MRKFRVLFFFLIIFSLYLFSNYYEDSDRTLSGKVTSYEEEQAVLLRVIDGDTIEAKVNGETWKIRLLGINTPEKNMPHSEDAKNFLLLFENKTITLLRDKENKDKYSRKLRYVFYEERFLNQEILENGWANSYYTDNLILEESLLRAEKQARTLELGIWKKSQELCGPCIILQELNFTAEFFIIENQCSFACGLENWFVKDAGRNIFKISSLQKNEKQKYSSENKDVWNNDGDKFFIFDSKGELVFFYEY